MTDLAIRPAQDRDHDAIWSILEPILRAGETYALPRDWDDRRGHERVSRNRGGRLYRPGQRIR